MKFESKFGPNQVVIYDKAHERGIEGAKGFIGTVVCIHFDGTGVTYLVDLQVHNGLQRVCVSDEQLVAGDLDYCQKTGSYPEDYTND